MSQDEFIDKFLEIIQEAKDRKYSDYITRSDLKVLLTQYEEADENHEYIAALERDNDDLESDKAELQEELDDAKERIEKFETAISDLYDKFIAGE